MSQIPTEMRVRPLLHVWKERRSYADVRLMSSPFIKTCLNNMNPDVTRLVCVTTANLLQQTVEDFCKEFVS